VVARPDHDAGSNDVDTVALSRRRLQGVLRCIAGELPDVPLYYELASLSSRMHVTCPQLPAVQAALMHAGYRVSGSHAIMGALKTDAPPEVVWGVMAAWVAAQTAATAPGQAPPKPQPAGSVGAALLASGAAAAAARPAPFNFVPSGAVAAEIARQRGGGPRYLPNPGDSWGPGSRASAAKAESKAVAREAAKAAATAAAATAAATSS
jgi:tRNA (guanine26-N2/guanine27-N2)-dimethyltransferase